MTLRDDVRYDAAATTLTAVIALLEDAHATPDLIEQVLRVKAAVAKKGMR